jgi:hypothetical protein
MIDILVDLFNNILFNGQYPLEGIPVELSQYLKAN